MKLSKDIVFSDKVRTTVEQETRIALQDKFSYLPVGEFANALQQFVLNHRTLSCLRNFLIFINTNLQTDDQICKFAEFLREYQSLFAINDLCEICLELGTRGVDFTQMHGLEFANKLLWTEQLMKILEWTDKRDFLSLFQATDIERLNYIQTNSGKSKYESEIILLTVRLNVLVALLSVTQVFTPQELEKLKVLMLLDSRKTRINLKNCLEALEELSKLDIILNTSDIHERNEFLALFTLYIEKYWLDPIVAKNIIAEFARLEIINSESDLYTLTSNQFMSVVDARFYSSENKVEIFACWFGDPEILALWRKLEPKDFQLYNMQILLLSSQLKYLTLGREAPKAIRQEVYDELNSILLNKQYKENRNLRKLVQAVPKDMLSFIMLKSFFDLQDMTEALLIFHFLPLNIKCISIRENDVTNKYTVPSADIGILNNIEKAIKSEDPLSIYNNELVTQSFEFTITKVVAWLEQTGTPLAYFVCGLLLANGGSENSRALHGQFFLDYQAKRLHDAVTFFNRAVKDASLHRNVMVMKMCMFYKNDSASVNKRLLNEEKPAVPRESDLLRDDTATYSQDEQVSLKVW